MKYYAFDVYTTDNADNDEFLFTLEEVTGADREEACITADEEAMRRWIEKFGCGPTSTLILVEIDPDGEDDWIVEWEDAPNFPWDPIACGRWHTRSPRP